MKKYLLALAAAGVLTVLSGAPVLAQQNQNQGSGGSNSAGSGAGNGNMGLNSARKQTCDNRKGTIDKTMKQYSATVQNRLMLFDKVAERIKTYYVENKLSVADYEQLMAQVTAQRQTATEAVNRVRQGTPAIDCASSDPLGNAQQYRTHIAAAQQSLKQYRAAIHNLLAAITTAVEDSEAQ